LYRDRAIAARTLMAKTAPYRLATGTIPLLYYRDNGPDGFAGNVYSLNRRAVSKHNIRLTKYLTSSIPSLFGGAANA
jgi:hypothetical protein